MLHCTIHHTSQAHAHTHTHILLIPESAGTWLDGLCTTYKRSFTSSGSAARVARGVWMGGTPASCRMTMGE
jgi:hypothetical protein